MRSYELKKKKGNLGLFLAAFFFISGYIFFLSSEMWMPSRLSASLQTPLRKAIDWGTHTEMGSSTILLSSVKRMIAAP